MNRTRITVAFTWALALAVGTACQKAPPAEQPSTPTAEAPRVPHVVCVTITSNTATDGSLCYGVNNDAVHVAVGDTLLWSNTVGRQVSVHFKEGSPFASNSVQIDSTTFAGAVVREGTSGQTFHYEVTPKGCLRTETGPDVIVDGGGMGPGHP